MTDVASRILENVSMARYTSLELGGEAQYFFDAKDRLEMIVALEWAASNDLSAVILGGGSNIVVCDEGIKGLVIRVAYRGRKLARTDEGVVVSGMAGENWDDFVSWSVGKGLTGIECLSGIPGTLGATPVQNVGAYGQEISSVIESVEAFDRHLGMTIHLSPDQCDFGYRSSRFRSEPGRWVILSAQFMLHRGNMKTIAYRELRRVLGNHLVAPPPSQIRDIVLGLRRAKSMLAEKTDPNRRSVGSFFINPIVSAETAERVRLIAIKSGGSRRSPGHVLADGMVKLPAAWLIEHSGFVKGLSRGNVGISDHHALCLVHHGGGTTAELVRLAGSIRKGVEEKFGLTLVPEPVFFGFKSSNPL